MQFQQPTMGRVLVVAGSDPSGGAGVQADIKTITMFGQYASAAITALTVQNTLGVTAVEPVALPIVQGQIEAVLSDIGADVVKTGMLHSAEVIAATLNSASECDYQGKWVIDPVMVATSGDRLLDEGAVDAVRRQLVPKADVLTPNIPEAEVLTGLSIQTIDDMRRAGEVLLDMGAKAVVLKGGHLSGNALTDLCMHQRGEEAIESERLDSVHTHGTGCTLASAMAAAISAGDAVDEAFKRAVAFVRQAIEKAPGFGAGHGPLGHSRVKM